MTDVAAPIAAPAEPEAVALPTPISVEPRVAPTGEAAEIARQAEEAKLPKEAAKPVKSDAKGKVEEPAKKLSTREALRAAREKVEAEPASPLKADPKTAEPAAKAADPAPAKPDNAKTAEPAKAADPAVTRAADGKFVSIDPVKAAEAAAAKAEPVKAAEPVKPSFTASAPPARFADAAKAKWAEAPEEIRAETERAITELTKGFEKHRESAARDADIAEFHERAIKGGTTVKAALTAYVGMEDALRADPVKGFEAIAKNLGIPLKDIAAKILNQAPDATASAADARVIALEKELADLKKGFGEIHAERTQAKTATTTETVTKFAADHPRFDELSDDIAFFLKTRCPGDLAKAYELAERLNPAPADAKPEPKEAAVASSAPAAPSATVTTLAPASTAPAKSIAGAPPAGSDPARKQPSSSIKEALKRARAAAG